MVTSEELQQIYNYATGTECYYKHPLTPLKYTDGVKAFATAGECYWLIDEIALTAIDKHIFSRDFTVITVTSKDNKAVILFEADTDKPLFKKHIEFTDLPAGVWKFYLIDGILLLTGEY